MSDNDSQYILCHKLDRRIFRHLYQYNIYHCEKVVKKTKIKHKIYTIVRVKIFTPEMVYDVFETTFNKHFMTLKEYRKLKLEKINKIKDGN